LRHWKPLSILVTVNSIRCCNIDTWFSLLWRF